MVQGLSAYFVWLNRGKESIVLDLKSPEGLEILRTLVSQADVLVQAADHMEARLRKALARSCRIVDRQRVPGASAREMASTLRSVVSSNSFGPGIDPKSARAAPIGIN